MKAERPSMIQRFLALLSNIPNSATTPSDPATQRKRLRILAEAAANKTGFDLATSNSEEYLLLMQPTRNRVGPDQKEILHFVEALKIEMRAACLIDSHEVEVIRRCCNKSLDIDPCARSQSLLVAIVQK